MDEYTREPCPWRILDDCGGAFSMGAIGGSIYHSFVGFKNAPSGSRRRLAGMIANVKGQAPRVGGQFAMWGLSFSSIDCALAAIRGKEDYWNSIVSGAATGGLLTIRAGPRMMFASAMIGGILLALIEGAGVVMSNMTASHFYPVNPEIQDPSVLPPKPSPNLQPEPGAEMGQSASNIFGGPLSPSGSSS